MVDGADIGSAYGGRLHPNQHFSVARLGDRNFAQNSGAVAWQIGAGHCAISPFRSHRSSQLWLSFQRNTCPLIRRQFLSMAAIARISSSVSGAETVACRLAT